MSSADPGVHHPLSPHRLLPPGPHLMENRNKSRNLTALYPLSCLSSIPLLDVPALQTRSTCQRQKSFSERWEILLLARWYDLAVSAAPTERKGFFVFAVFPRGLFLLRIIHVCCSVM